MDYKRGLSFIINEKFEVFQTTFCEMNTLAICAIFKNEAPYLKEWIEYHRIIGVEHFYLYDNGSQDGGRDVLEPYIQKKEVTWINWPNQGQEKWHDRPWAWVHTTQVSAYEHAFEIAKSETKWIAAIDIDEFLVPHQTNSMIQLLEDHDAYPALEVSWEIFGTSHVAAIPPRSLMIDLLRKKAPSHCSWNAQCKTILKPTYYKRFVWPPHRSELLCDQKPFSLEKTILTLNHYICRADEEFQQRIRNRETILNGSLTEAEMQILKHLGNEEEDLPCGIQRFIPLLYNTLFDLG